MTFRGRLAMIDFLAGRTLDAVRSIVAFGYTTAAQLHMTTHFPSGPTNHPARQSLQMISLPFIANHEQE
jgi:hypothetical protein